MKRKITGLILINFIAVFLLCGITACSPLKKMTKWIPFRGDEKYSYILTDEKIEKFTRTIKSVSSDTESHYRLACFFQERKKHRLAIEEFKKALQNDPSYVKAYNGLGVSYDLLGEFPRAVKAYEAALRLNPKLAYVYNNLGYSYLLQEKLEPAAKAFQQAVALDQENRQYHNNLALAYGKQGKYDLAFNEFKCAGNEEQARRHMARLFNHVPTNVPPQKTLIAENIPTDDYQDSDQENPVKPPLKNQGIREQKLGDFPSGSLAQKGGKQSNEFKKVASLNNSYTETKSALRSTKADRSEKQVEPVRYAAINSTQNSGALPQPSSPVDDKAQSSFNGHPHSQNSSAEIEIEISNGNGIRHFARNVGAYLAQKGFFVASLKNEPYFTIEKTKIYYCEGHLQDAYHVAKQIPRYQDMVKVSRFENRNIKIRVVIGQDMLPYYKGIFFKAEPLRSL